MTAFVISMSREWPLEAPESFKLNAMDALLPSPSSVAEFVEDHSTNCVVSNLMGFQLVAGNNCLVGLFGCDTCIDHGLLILESSTFFCKSYNRSNPYPIDAPIKL